MEWPALAELARDAFPEDVIARAKELQSEIGSIGAYSHSQGVPFVRKNVARFIQGTLIVIAPCCNFPPLPTRIQSVWASPRPRGSSLTSPLPSFSLPSSLPPPESSLDRKLILIHTTNQLLFLSQSEMAIHRTRTTFSSPPARPRA